MKVKIEHYGGANMNKLELLESLLPDSKQPAAYHPVKVFVDNANNKVYLQSDPYIENGVVKVRRLAEYDLVVETAYQVVTEYQAKVNY